MAGVFREKRDNLLDETDIILHFRGIILWDANISNNSINLKKVQRKGTVQKLFYSLTLSF